VKNIRGYRNTFFSAEVLAAALAQLATLGAPKKDESSWYLSTLMNQSEWYYDTVEEFYADYRKRPYTAQFQRHLRYKLKLIGRVYDENAEVEVEAPDRRISNPSSRCLKARGSPPSCRSHSLRSR
jgi:hypothetical protein